MWQKLVAEQARSGETVAAFRRERGLCAPHFYWWKKRLPEAARLIAALFAVEKQGRELSAEQRLALRQLQSTPRLVELRKRLLAWKEQLPPKHPMAEAVNYTLGQSSELNVFCSDGAVPIDNNVSEREMKRVVLNRKNSLFVGNPRARGPDVSGRSWTA